MELNPSKICQICYDEALDGKPHKHHFGAVCCNSCKNFFRRIVQNKGRNDLKSIFECVSKVPGQKCDMKDFGMTHRCSKCRLERCLEVGILPEKVLLDPDQRTKFTGKSQYQPITYVKLKMILSFYSLGKKKRKQVLTEETSTHHGSSPTQQTTGDSMTNPSSEENHDQINNPVSQQVVTEPTPAQGKSPQTASYSITNPSSEEKYEQMNNQISQAISMDFFETIAENNLSQQFKDEVMEFFKTDNSLDERMSYDLGKYFSRFSCQSTSSNEIKIQIAVFQMRSTLMKFLSKTAFFNSIPRHDQEVLVQENLGTLVAFCFLKCQTSQFGYDQYSWLTLSNPTEVDWQQIELKTNPIKKFLDQSMNSESLNKVLRLSTYATDALGHEMMSHPSLILLTLIFNTENWNWIQEFISEKKKISSIFNLCVSILAKEAKIGNDEVAQLKLFGIKHLQEMSKLLPKYYQSNQMMRLSTQPVLQDKDSMKQWLQDQFMIIDQATYEIQHAELIEGVAAKSKEILAGTISHDFMPMFIKSMGLVLISRIKFILARQNGGLQLISSSRDFQNVLGLSVFLQVLRITSMGSMRGALHDFYGE